LEIVIGYRNGRLILHPVPGLSQLAAWPQLSPTPVLGQSRRTALNCTAGQLSALA
jgi:hypothetical protein